MKLLIITQKVDINDPILGFFHRWIEEFSKHCEKITVICLYKGEYRLPPNVKVLSLGKEEGANRLRYLSRFYRYIKQEKDNYDDVFVHMNPVYVILGASFWRSNKKKIGLWYAHKSIDWKLKMAERASDIIFTASLQSFRLKSNKVKIMGHGIDVEKFNCTDIIPDSKGIFKIITVGRISPVKDFETLFKALEIIKKTKEFKLFIIGAPMSADEGRYLDSLKKIIKEKNLSENINFIGPVPNKDITPYLCGADLSVNMSHTGSLDKAILESMASGLPVLTSNESFFDVVGKEDAVKYFFNKKDFQGLANKIETFYSQEIDQKNIAGERLRKIVSENHNLEKLIPKILKSYANL